MRIPKIIHQTWKTEDIPGKMLPLQKSWKHYNPNWEYRLWTDKDIEAFILSEYPEYIDLFATMSTIEKIDAWRPLVLHKHGGLYVDLDYECLKAIDPLLENHTIALGQEPLAHAKLYNYAFLTSNAMMASIPQHEFWICYLDTIKERKKQFDSPIESTGPRALLQAFEQFNSKITLLDPTLICPIPDLMNRELWPQWAKKIGKIYRPIARNKLRKIYRSILNDNQAYAIHWWAGSWTSLSKKKRTFAAIKRRPIS